MTGVETEATEVADLNVASGDLKVVANLNVATERKDFNYLRYELSRKAKCLPAFFTEPLNGR